MKLIDGLADHPLQKKSGRREYNVTYNGENMALLQQHACDPPFVLLRKNTSTTLAINLTPNRNNYPLQDKPSAIKIAHRQLKL